MSTWAVIASQYFDKVPLQLWEARKARLVAERSTEVYAWDSFAQWCLTSFNVQKQERHIFTELMSLRQNGSVAEYKVAHCGSFLCSFSYLHINHAACPDAQACGHEFICAVRIATLQCCFTLRIQRS